MAKKIKLYTKTGDSGETRLFGGDKISKDNLRVSSYGEIDELNSLLGVVRSAALAESKSGLEEKLKIMQNTLFDIGSELACVDQDKLEKLNLVSEAQVQELENWIDQADAACPALRNFILPGGTMINSFLHLARAVCRRAERSIVTLSKEEKVRSLLLVYINRLSDLLFVLARYEIVADQGEELLKT